MSEVEWRQRWKVFRPGVRNSRRTIPAAHGEVEIEITASMDRGEDSLSLSRHLTCAARTLPVADALRCHNLDAFASACVTMVKPTASAPEQMETVTSRGCHHRGHILKRTTRPGTAAACELAPVQHFDSGCTRSHNDMFFSRQAAKRARTSSRPGTLGDTAPRRTEFSRRRAVCTVESATP